MNGVEARRQLLLDQLRELSQPVDGDDRFRRRDRVQGPLPPDHLLEPSAVPAAGPPPVAVSNLIPGRLRRGAASRRAPRRRPAPRGPVRTAASRAPPCPP